jgi:putative membrane protein
LDKSARKEKNKMMGMMGFGLIIPLLVIGGIAYALGWRPQFNETRTSQTRQTPLELLKSRYARGELSSEQYDQMRRNLEG